VLEKACGTFPRQMGKQFLCEICRAVGAGTDQGRADRDGIRLGDRWDGFVFRRGMTGRQAE